MTTKVFEDDAYAQTCDATVVAVTDEGAVQLDRTVLYATSGGQPGDTGWLERADGTKLAINGTTYADGGKSIVLHHPAEDGPLLKTGETVTVHLDWPRRYRLMQMHTACHILSVVVPHPITGAAVSEDNSRVDIDLAAPVTKEEVTAAMQAIVDADHPVFTRWITRAELEANPGLVKSKNVRPPANAERVRLVCIGEDAAIDSQPCGGTHVQRTGELGTMHIGKIEKKGRENRRFRIRFGTAPA